MTCQYDVDMQNVHTSYSVDNVLVTLGVVRRHRMSVKNICKWVLKAEVKM